MSYHTSDCIPQILLGFYLLEKVEVASIEMTKLLVHAIIGKDVDTTLRYVSYSCNMSVRGLPNMYTQCPRACNA